MRKVGLLKITCFCAGHGWLPVGILSLMATTKKQSKATQTTLGSVISSSGILHCQRHHQGLWFGGAGETCPLLWLSGNMYRKRGTHIVTLKRDLNGRECDVEPSSSAAYVSFTLVAMLQDSIV